MSPELIVTIIFGTSTFIAMLFQIYQVQIARQARGGACLHFHPLYHADHDVGRDLELHALATGSHDLDAGSLPLSLKQFGVPVARIQTTDRAEIRHRRILERRYRFA